MPCAAAFALAGLLAVAARLSGAVAEELSCEGLAPELEPSPPADFLGPLEYVTVGNHRLAYRRIPRLASRSAGCGAAAVASSAPPTCAGDQPTPLVLIGGYGCTSSTWGSRLLYRLAQARALIIFDNPAQGLSEEVEPSSEPLMLPTLTEAAVGLLDALNLSRPHLAGWSLGACVALKLAIDHLERIGKVVSWAGTSLDSRAILGEPAVLQQLFSPTNGHGEYAAVHFNTSKEEGRRAACRWLADIAAMPRDEGRAATNMRYAAGIQASLKPDDTSIWDGLALLPTPVLLMGGSEDAAIPPRAQLALAERIPGSWLARFKGTGHGFFFERVEEVAAVMDAFLGAGSAAAEPGQEAAGAGRCGVAL